MSNSTFPRFVAGDLVTIDTPYGQESGRVIGLKLDEQLFAWVYDIATESDDGRPVKRFSRHQADIETREKPDGS